MLLSLPRDTSRLEKSKGVQSHNPHPLPCSQRGVDLMVPIPISLEKRVMSHIQLMASAAHLNRYVVHKPDFLFSFVVVEQRKG